MSETARIARLLLEQTFEGPAYDDILERQPPVVSGPFYVTLHGTIQHGVYHAGQIALLKRGA